MTSEIPWSHDPSIKLGSHITERILAGERLPLPQSVDLANALIEICWHGDPKLRPEFVEIYNKLEKLKQFVPEGSQPVPTPRSPQLSRSPATSPHTSMAVGTGTNEFYRFLIAQETLRMSGAEAEAAASIIPTPLAENSLEMRLLNAFGDKVI